MTSVTFTRDVHRGDHAHLDEPGSNRDPAHETTHTPVGTLVLMANEAFELFFALLAFLALGGSVAVVVARFAGGVSGRNLVAGLAPLGLAIPALVTSVSMIGSLYFSEAVGYRPCVLCWYQRIAMYSLAIVLVIAAIRKDRAITPYAMALAGVGTVISGYHWLLE